MKRNLSIVLLLLAISTSLSAKSIYVQVMSVYQQSNLFNVSYRLNELGYTMNVSEKNGLYKVYSGPFEDRWSANVALKEIKKKIAGDAYIVELTIDKKKIVVEKETKSPKNIERKKAPTKVTIIKKSEPAIYSNNIAIAMNKSQNIDNRDSKIAKGKFFVGFNAGTAKFDLNRVNVSMSSVGYAYGLEVGYYFDENIFLTLNYAHTTLTNVYFDTFYTSLNYKFSPIYLVTPSIGLLAGLNSMKWENSVYVDSVESSFVPGLQLATEIAISDSATLILFGRYMQLDYTSTSKISPTTKVQFNNEISGNIGLRYNF